MEDIDALAPITPRATRCKVEDSDPELEDDLAAWFDVDCQLPRLTLLGPVGALTRGDATVVAKRKPHHVELLAFLALHPGGVTSSQIAGAFTISTAHARTDINAVRTWLGVNPVTGCRHLPAADASRAAQLHGMPTYQVEGLVVDVDLFRRLRARGQPRGNEGMTDLVTAHRLVSGQPFEQLRPAAWSWLLEGNRLDQHMECAIVDVAHVVTTHSLAEDDFDCARTTVETARRAAPYDEISQLDLVAVMSAEGHQELAERLLVGQICNRTEDDMGPVDLPERTQQVIGQRDWLRSRRPAKR